MEKRISALSELPGVAKSFLQTYPEGAVVGLSGDLGAGKTTFVRAVIATIAGGNGVPAPRVISPTYVLHQSYVQLRPPIEHFDLYRLHHVSEESLIELGYYETVERCREARGFAFVEWPEHSTERKLLHLDTTITVSIETAARIFSWP